jgi:hypothetical protein
VYNKKIKEGKTNWETKSASVVAKLVGIKVISSKENISLSKN